MTIVTKAVTTHRVRKIVRGGDLPEVSTKGDNNDSVDPFTLQLQGNQLWYMRTTVPKVGYLIHALRTPWMLAVAMACLALLAGTWLWRIWFPDAASSEDHDESHDSGAGAVDGA